MTELSPTKVFPDRFETSFSSQDGLKLFAVHDPAPETRARVAIVHGFAEHLGRYDRLAGEFVAAGFSCHRFDLRGHGRSEGKRGHVSRLSAYRDDLDRFFVHINQLDGRAGPAKEAGSVESRRAPLFVLAHSVGGLIALSYVLEHPTAIDSLAVSSPFLCPAFRLPLLAKSLGPIARYVIPTLAIPNAIEPGSLTRDPAVVEAYKRDPLVVHTLTAAWWYAIRDGQKELDARAAEITVPVLFLLGDADRLADWRHSRALFERLASAQKRLKVYPGLFHEVLNELGREQVIADVLAWFEESLRNLASD